jgi:hypothetical protein
MYEASGASEAKFVDGVKLGENLHLVTQDTDDVMRYLEGEGLLRFVTAEGLIAITHQGVVEIEQALEHPEAATEHFAPGTIVINGDVVGSQIQTGGTQSPQTMTIDYGTDVAFIANFLSAMTTAMALTPLTSPEDNRQAELMIALLEAQLRRSEPDKGLTKPLLRALRDFSLAMAGSGAWVAVVEIAHQLPH